MAYVSKDASRREFLKRTGALSVAGAAAPLALSLAATSEAAAQTAPDYKALVCVFLYGGNDWANTVVPYDQASYDAYFNLRSNVAIPRNNLTANLLNPATPLPNGRQFALAPTLAPLVPFFNNNQLAVALNMGTLVAPTTKQQYVQRSVPLPPKLLSHNDQQSYWQSGATEGAPAGWGGRMGDLFASGNGNSTFTCMSVTGNTVFLSGNQVVQYQVSSNGAIAVNSVRNPMFGSAACSQAMQSLLTQSRSHLLETEYTRVGARTLNAYDLVTQGLALPAPTTMFPATGLGSQLRLVARLIAARNTLGAKRQVFFVSTGGFDNHDSLNTSHPGLLAGVANAMAAFQNAMNEIGAANMVTTFTGSDFGRTLSANTDGSDHGWGSMQFVMGGAVQGRSFIGQAPAIANNGPDDIGQGRLLPTTSVDQLGATLANWFGVSASNQLTLFPNLANFTTRNLGFLA